jgi:hypothetical protein
MRSVIREYVGYLLHVLFEEKKPRIFLEFLSTEYPSVSLFEFFAELIFSFVK